MGLGRLHERVAVVTGAGGRGIGQAISAAVGREGGRVVAIDIDVAGLERTVAAVEAAGSEALAVEADITDAEAMTEMIQAAVSAFGRIDVLYNSAAAQGGGGDGDIETTSIDVWNRVMAINLTAPMHLAQLAIPVMRRGGGGSIVNISSTAAFNGDLVHIAYNVSKAALNQLTRCIAASHGTRGIRCNTIATGLVLPDNQDLLSEDKVAVYKSNLLVNDVGRPDDVAELAVFLASDAARYIQGAVLVVDGGFLAHQPWHSQANILHPEVIAGYGSDPLTTPSFA